MGKTIIERVSTHNTYEKNVVCCIEEMSELIKVLCKEQRKSSKFNEDQLKEELSHVLLMCRTICLQIGLTNEEIFKIQLNAVERMENNE